MGTVLLAAALVSASLLGVAIADREPARDQVPATNDRTSMSLEDFSDLIRQAEFDDSEAFLGTLAPTAKGGRAGGSALTIASPSVDDQVIVIAAGLSPRERRLPYRVTLRDAQGHRMRVGMIRSVDAGGGATVGRIVRGSLIGFMYVVVRDANGVIVLEGTLGAPTALLSPSPTVLRGVPRQP
jgi:hypothetical protein